MIIINSRQGKQRDGLIEMIDYIDKIKPVKSMSILEVGSFTGSSAAIFAERFKRVYCVDSWSDIGLSDASQAMWKSQGYTKEILENEFDKTVAQFDNVTKIKGESIEIAFNFTEKVDIIYIDASHDYGSVKADIIAWKRHARQFITGHDFWPGRFDGVIQAVREVLGEPEKVCIDNSWIVRIADGS
jgi:hypothetical protein